MHDSIVYNGDALITGLLIGSWFIGYIFAISALVIVSQLVNQLILQTSNNIVFIKWDQNGVLKW